MKRATNLVYCSVRMGAQSAQLIREGSAMHLNADFTKRAVVHAAKLDWKTSPIPGVERRMLDRIGDEVARATSIVRYAPRSEFSPHVHDGGEEILVLEGVFQDEHGDFPAGCYVRNPPQSRHTPGSKLGCTIFVKLWQFDPADRTHVRIDTNKMALLEVKKRDGVWLMPLFKDAREDVRLEQWAPGGALHEKLKPSIRPELDRECFLSAGSCGNTWTLAACQQCRNKQGE